jgi:hypothetical protein
LFDRGWLPEILPPSSRDIRVSNDLELNTSEGEFRFASPDFALMQAELKPFSNPKHPFTRVFDWRIDSHIAAGHPAYQYEQDRSTWVFLCKPAQGQCTYTMWSQRPDDGGYQQ